MSVKTHEAFSLDSFQDRLLWWDDFLGDQLKDEWNTTFVGGGSAVVVDLQMGGIVRVLTGGTNLDSALIDWGDIRSLLVTKRVSMEIRVKMSSTASNVIQLELNRDSANRIMFRYSDGVGPTWVIWCEDGDVITSRESGIAVDTDYHIFRIECHTHGASHVHFYIDGVETANSPITTNVPDDAGDYLQPFLSLTTSEDVSKSIDIDYVGVRQEI